MALDLVELLSKPFLLTHTHWSKISSIISNSFGPEKRSLSPTELACAPRCRPAEGAHPFQERDGRAVDYGWPSRICRDYFEKRFRGSCNCSNRHLICSCCRLRFTSRCWG